MNDQGETNEQDVVLAKPFTNRTLWQLQDLKFQKSNGTNNARIVPERKAQKENISIPSSSVFCSLLWR